MRTSGLILDLYDDAGGEVLRTFFPRPDDVPAFIKAAHAMTEQEAERLPDDAFALVMVDGQEKLRKYACFDQGNTALSVLYFLKTAHALPGPARDLCAANLKVACGWFGLPFPEEHVKRAGLVSAMASHAARNPLQTAATAMTAPSLVRGTRDNIKGNLATVRAAEAHGGVGAGLGALGGHERLASANLDDLALRGTFGSPAVEDVSPPAFDPYVDVSAPSVEPSPGSKAASRYALPTRQRYPLDAYDHVVKAASYFEEHGHVMPAADRREFCVNLVERAGELGIGVGEKVAAYGGADFADPAVLGTALDLRRMIVSEEDASFLDKLAASRAHVGTHGYFEALEAFDRALGLDHHYGSRVPDPYLSTYAPAKTTAKAESDWSAIVGGNEYITGPTLRHASLSRRARLSGIFGDDFCDEFAKDPIGIFKSMPDEQKLIIARIANDNGPAR